MAVWPTNGAKKNKNTFKKLSSRLKNDRMIPIAADPVIILQPIYSISQLTPTRPADAKVVTLPLAWVAGAGLIFSSRVSRLRPSSR